MVFTHVLIARLEDISSIDNLNVLFSHFVTLQTEDVPEIKKLSFDSSSFYLKTEVNPIAGYIQQTVQKLVSSATPIIFCGTLDSFQNAIVTTWAGLPFAFRKHFAFTAGFSLNNLDKAKTIIYFQKNLSGILKNTEYISDENEQLVDVTSEVERYLLYPEASTGFESFLSNLGVNLNDWLMLGPCVKAYHAYLLIKEGIDPDELKLLIRNVAKVSPDPSSGKEIKAEIMNCLSDQISTGKEVNVKSLRNLPVSEFENGQELLGKGIKNLISQVFSNLMPFNVDLILELSSLIKDLNSENWWNQAVITAFRTEGESKKETVLKNIWQLFTHSEKSIPEFLRFIPTKKERERQLIEYIPESVSKPIAESISKLMRERNWLLLHAHLILKYKVVKLAIVEQVDLEEKQNSETFEGTTFLLSRINDDELLSVTLSKGSFVLVSAYGERSVHKPALLSKIDIDNPLWLKIWSISLATTKDLYHGVKDISDNVSKVIDLLLNKSSVPDNIIALIGQSEFSDLTAHPKRKEIWKKIPAKYKPTFLEATARGYIKKITEKNLAKTDPEEELLTIITSEQFTEDFLNQKQRDITPVLSLYEQIQGLSDKLLAKYIYYYSGRISEIQSSQLGTLIQTQQFTLSARQIFEKAKQNREFKLALTNCQALIQYGFMERITYWYLFGDTLSEEMVYSALLEFAIGTYSLGPEDREIWIRSGGELSKLSNSNTREENWRRALKLLQNGGGGKHISTKSLIKTMLEDFPNNNQLKDIQKYFR